jgi:hypothetical protein
MVAELHTLSGKQVFCLPIEQYERLLQIIINIEYTVHCV